MTGEHVETMHCKHWTRSVLGWGTNLVDVLGVELEAGLRVENLLDLEDVGDLVAEARLDAHLERHGGAGAGATGALELEHDDEAVDLVQRHVAAVRHQARPYLVQHPLHVLLRQGKHAHRPPCWLHAAFVDQS
jgi:hypothetical protein